MKSTLKIRPVAKDDLTRIFQLEEETFKPKHYPLFVLRQLYDISSDLFFVAVDEFNQIKGYCFGGINHVSKIGWVFALATIKEEQNKKIGQRLTTELLNALKAKGISTIQLTTSSDNSAAIHLYEKVGFKKMTETLDYYFDNTPRFLMKLEVE